MVRKQSRRRSAPQRTCIACRTVRPKRELVRIVRTPEGRILIDEKGKCNGRGAYLCAQQDCWERALARRQLETALQATLDKDTAVTLQAYAEAFPGRLQTEDPPESSPIRE